MFTKIHDIKLKKKKKKKKKKKELYLKYYINKLI